MKDGASQVRSFISAHSISPIERIELVFSSTFTHCTVDFGSGNEAVCIILREIAQRDERKENQKFMRAGYFATRL